MIEYTIYNSYTHSKYVRFWFNGFLTNFWLDQHDRLLSHDTIYLHTRKVLGINYYGQCYD